MSDSRDTSPATFAIDTPPILAADLSDTPGARHRWYWTIAPAYAGVFIWVPFFDQLSRDTLPYAPWPVLVCAGLVAAILCDLLLFRAPALWGYRSEGRFSVVAAATIGLQGSKWITGPLLGLAAVVWQAVALSYALDLIFRALIECHLIEPSVLVQWRLGPLVLRPPIVLLTAFWWVFITRLAGKSFAHVIATLMKVYTPTALCLLAATMVVSVTRVSPYRSVGPGDLFGSQGDLDIAFMLPALRLIHLIFAFFAMAGLMAADWGRTVPDERGTSGSVGWSALG